jgi:hypothetical protein
MLLSLLAFLSERETALQKEPPSPTFFYRGAADLQQKMRELVVTVSRFWRNPSLSGERAFIRSDFCHVRSQLCARLQRFEP